MKTRLYFLVPDEDMARNIVSNLRALDLPEDAVLAVAHRERYPLEGLPEAGITARTDIVNAAKKGVSIGGAAGLVAGLVAASLPPSGLVLAGGALVGGLTAAGAAFGTWSATLVGIGATNAELEAFEDALEAGQILMLVDVEESRADEVEGSVRAHLADAVICAGHLDETGSALPEECRIRGLGDRSARAAG
ncbi:MAG: hypothetical protein V2I63_04235 [Pseudomonadales bacterium]|jgi:hypothetical protein|nr:hypothetical protein [Pseudomonadales bacterium]